MTTIEKIAIRFHAAVNNYENPYRATDGVTDSVKALKAGRELGIKMLKVDLRANGVDEAKADVILESLGV